MIQKLGKYQITEKLGEGAMGAVYKAYDEVLDRYVAVKTMASDIKWDPELKLRFYREARSAASLHHPNIVTIHDLGEEGKMTFIVMELLVGQDLKNVIREKSPLTLEQKLSIMAQVGDGLSHAHLHGIIHRDVKPGNIHVTPAGNVKILDFGIARIPSSDLTRSGVRLGTPVYMSPEQIRGVEYDERSDIFSAGIVFYELLTYVHPFRDKNIVKTMDNILLQTHFPFQDQLPDAPPGLFPILNNCLAKEPGNRYGSMAEVSRAFRRLSDELNLATQKMKTDLQGMLPRLRSLASQAGAPQQLPQILQRANRLLEQEEKPDFLTLQRLLAELAGEIVPQHDEPSASKATEEPIGPHVAPQSEAEDVFQKTHITAPVRSFAEAAQHFASGIKIPEPPAAGPEVPSGTAGATPPVPGLPAGPSPADELRGRELMSAGEAMLNENRFQEAVDCFRQAITLIGPKDELVRLLAETRRRIEDHKRARVAEFFEKARAALAGREFAQAIDFLDEVIQLQPDHTEAAEMQRQARAEMESEKARQARKAEGEREKQLGFKLLSDKMYRESLRALTHARELLGEDSAIDLGIEEAGERVRAEELQARVQSELAEATSFLRANSFEKARLQVNRVLEFAPQNPQALELLDRVVKAEELKRLEEQLAGFRRRAAEALQRLDFNEALLLANQALQLNPSDGQSQALLQKIQSEQEQARKDQESARLVAKAQEAQAQQDFDGAAALLESALQVNPKDSRAAALLRELKQSREEKLKRKEFSAELAQARQAFLRGELDVCEAHVNKASAIIPQHPSAKELLEHIAQARKKALQAQIAEIITQGRRALGVGEFSQARSLAQKALETDPECAEAAASHPGGVPGRAEETNG